MPPIRATYWTTQHIDEKHKATANHIDHVRFTARSPVVNERRYHEQVGEQCSSHGEINSVRHVMAPTIITTNKAI